jgi:hypothetical protein
VCVCVVAPPDWRLVKTKMILVNLEDFGTGVEDLVELQRYINYSIMDFLKKNRTRCKVNVVFLFFFNFSSILFGWLLMSVALKLPVKFLSVLAAALILITLG